MNEFRKSYDGNLYKHVPDSFIKRYGGKLMNNENFFDVVRFNKTSNESTLLGVSAEGGRFIYGGIRQFENFYGATNMEGNQNICAPTNLKLDKDDFADFSFQSDSKVALLSMGGTLLYFDINAKKLIKSVKNLERSAFCNTFDNHDLVLVGNRTNNDLKLFDLRDLNKPVSSVSSTQFPNRKILVRRQLRSLCHLGEKFYAAGFTANEKFISIYDMRYIKCNEPAQRLNLPLITRDTCGVYAMKLDRTCTKLFAACTDGCFREYCLSSGSNDPTNFYCGGLTNKFDHSFALSPLSDHFIASMRDGVGIWDYQKTIVLDNNLLMERKSPLKSSKTNSPSRLFLSPGLAGASPKRLFLSPSQKIQQLSLCTVAEKVMGMPTPKFNFKPSNEQEIAHCDWSNCGRYIVMTSDTGFTICDNENDFARNTANNDHSETNFSSYAIPINLTFPSYVQNK